MTKLQSEGGRFRAFQESGVALVIVLLVMLVLTLLSAALVFTARSETIASTNYALDTEADYVAKAGIQSALNWFRSTHYNPVPGTTAGAGTDYNVTNDNGAFQLYTSNANPVLCIANCTTNNSRVQLINYSGSTNYTDTSHSNFPSGITNGGGTAIATAFLNDLNGVRISGDSTHSGLFYVNAYLLSYSTVMATGSVVPMETWLITSKGVWTGTNTQTGAIATAEEQAIFQPIYTSGTGEAMYGYCSLTLSGSSGVCTDSYNSALGAYGGGNISVAAGACGTNSPNVLSTGGNIGANGFVSISHNPAVDGDVFIGNANPALVPSTCCSGGACGMFGATGNVTGSVITGAPYVTAPAVVTFPGSGQTGAFPGAAPSAPATIPKTAGGVTPSGTIPDGTGNTYNQPCTAGQTCNGSQANPYLISSMGGTTIYGGAGPASPVYYDIDSISLAGNSAITISGYVVLNVKTSLSIKGNGIANGINNAPEQCVINFAGASASVGGNGDISAVINAPAASITLGGGGAKGAVIGSISALSIDDQGGVPVHYDIQLNRLNGALAQSLVTSYTRIKQ